MRLYLSFIYIILFLFFLHPKCNISFLFNKILCFFIVLKFNINKSITEWTHWLVLFHISFDQCFSWLIPTKLIFLGFTFAPTFMSLVYFIKLICIKAIFRTYNFFKDLTRFFTDLRLEFKLMRLFISLRVYFFLFYLFLIVHA